MGIFSSIRNKIRKHRETMKSVSPNEIIAIALENGGKITAGALSARTVLSVQQAGMKLYTLNSQGVFRTKYDYKDNANVFILKKPELYKNLNLQTPKRTIITPSTEKKTLTDASVIHTALKAKGRITPGVLCLKADISIDEAKKKLQELQHKGVFDIEATANGALVYVLNDLETFEELMQDQLTEDIS